MLAYLSLSFALSLFICLLVICSKRFHIHRTAKGHSSATKQSAHRVPTPRIGGLGLLSFVAVGASVYSEETSRIVLLLSVSSLPVFLGGFGEDIGFNISPVSRLLLSFTSGAIAIYLFDAWIENSGITIIDLVLSIYFVSILFTIFVSGGLCHSFNLIDGLNGLATGLGTLMSLAFAYISFLTADYTMLTVSLTLAASILGVFAINFPMGRIFLGDAGAYTIGHLLTWVAILLMNRNDEVAPFALFLVFFWPVADMLFAVMRRIRNKAPIDQPDRMHFHQFVMRALELTIVNDRSISNPLAACTICILASVPILTSVFLFSNSLLAAIAWVICFILFVWTYVCGIRLARHISLVRKNKEKLIETISREGFKKLRRAASGKGPFPAE